VQDRLLLERDGDVATLVFNRPERLNAMTIESWQLMGRHLAELGEDRGIRCLILAGAGRAFLAGHDVAEIREHNEMMAAGKLSASQLREWQKALQNTTRFPEVNIGVTITNGGTYFLPRKIGLAKARELAYTGEFIDAKEAYRIGLVNRIVPAGQERAEAEKLARRIASRAPVAIQLHKTMLDRSLEASLETMLSFETEALVQTALTRDNLEGTNAYFEKREPKFTGE
jgi:enoyl-CoA hydratase